MIIINYQSTKSYLIKRFIVFEQRNLQCLRSYIYQIMTDKLSKTGAELNATFVPKDLIRKTQTKNINTLTMKKQFQKTTGNIYIEFEPVEIKFVGYELDKILTANIKIVNKAPIPQRVHVLPPEEPCFTIKANKKGPIASGMSEIVQVFFKISQYKYKHDVVKINTQTQNFIVPLYAYPTIPNLQTIFPKLIDFGSVQLRQPTSNYYPIVNPVPIDFLYQFVYQRECQQIMITPISGVIPANQTLNIQIAFIPNSKCTYTAEVYLKVKQFDFQPILIKIMGTGKQKRSNTSNKRIKSSKLAPLLKDNSIKNIVEPQDQKQKTMNMSNKQPNLKNTSNNGLASFKRTQIRTGYPKLLNTKKSIVFDEEGNKTLNPSKIAQKQYLNKFSKIQDLDKEKQIKFATFLGDKAMSQQQLEYEKEITKQIKKAILKTMTSSCLQRANPQLTNNTEVQYAICQQFQTTWDDKKNDEHHNRRAALLRFMNAGSRVILKYRLLKRIAKIKQFIGNCQTKEEMKKKVEESHMRALDKQSGNDYGNNFSLEFSLDSLNPSFFQLQFQDSNEAIKQAYFKPEGKTIFDDLTEIKQLSSNKQQILKFSEATYPSDYFNLSKIIPSNRSSAEEQYAYKTSAVPNYQPFVATKVYQFPLKAPANYFIYDDQKIRKYNNYLEQDQKNLEYLFDEDGLLQDQFQGWTFGESQILKAKFLKNQGCQYHTFSSYNYSSFKHGLGPFASLGQKLPFNIDFPTLEDTIQQGDSDEQKLPSAEIQSTLKLLQKIQANNNDLKERRQKKQIRNPERDMRKTIEKTIEDQKSKMLFEYVGRLRENNKFVQKPQNRFLF